MEIDNKTLEHILKYLESRLKQLEKRKQAPITCGRIHEIQITIDEIQTLIIKNNATTTTK